LPRRPWKTPATTWAAPGKTPSGYQAFLYGDRDIYRPGETVYLNAVVRNAKWETAGEFPVKVKVVSPNGKEFALLKAT
jgi:uncharacterized protein YfaS (alpha-2-macroglobulin family)